MQLSLFVFIQVLRYQPLRFFPPSQNSGGEGHERAFEMLKALKNVEFDRFISNNVFLENVPSTQDNP